MVYTTKEAAEVLKVHEETIKRLLRSGKLKGFKVGRAWRITEEELKAYSKNE